MIETIHFNGKKYPKLQSQGFASQYSFALAKQILPQIGIIYDIGFSNPAWQYPGSIGIDISKEDDFHAMNLPDQMADGIYSSHCLEHLDDYVSVLEYWNSRLKHNGILFMYLPNCDYQEYWQPTSNRKHKIYMNPALMQKYFAGTINMWWNVFVTEGYDLNGSFYCIAQKL